MTQIISRFCKYFLIVSITLISLSCKQEKTEKPNIILFLVDDMGWQDTSVPFHTNLTDFNNRYNTPAMERLASEGMKFTQAYASSVCSHTELA